MSDIRISLIVPVYNVEKYLERCLDSILGQTYRNLQIIVVDDGATDNSAAIVDDYANRDNRITVIHKENGGLSDARNAGLAVADGEYIGYVDSDDWIDSTMYETMLSAMLEADAEVAICRYKQITPDKVIDGSSGVIVPLSRDELLNIYVNEHPQYIIYNSVWSKLYKRELVQDLVFPKGKNSEDIVYTTTAFCRLQRAVYIDKGLYNYVVARPDSIMNNSKSGERCINDEIPFLRRQIELYKEYGYELVAKQATYMFYVRLLTYYVKYYSDKNTRQYAEKIISLIKADDKIVKEICKEDFVSKGYRMRLKMALNNPVLYYRIESFYEKVIVPLKSKG